MTFKLTFIQFFCLFSFLIFRCIILVDSQLKFSHVNQNKVIVGLSILTGFIEESSAYNKRLREAQVRLPYSVNFSRVKIFAAEPDFLILG